MIDPERCKKVVNAIRDLSNTEIDELFKLLYKENCEYTQNNNGIFFNLSWVSEETMLKIERFIEFCNQSNTELVRYETLCDVLNHKLYEGETSEKKLDQDVSISIAHLRHKIIIEKDIEMRRAGANKVSSSMRFYLLKKKFSKPMVLTSTYENDLMAESYIL